MGSGNTFFSIVIPTYNRENFIATTLKHALGSNYDNFEIIVVDDGSKDGTKEQVLSIQSEKIKYIYTENGERGRARNIGTQNATGEYITYLDSDDIIYPEALHNANNVIKRNPGIEFFHLSYEMKLPDGKTQYVQNLNYSDYNKELIHGNFLGCIGVFVQRKIALENPFSEDRNFAGSEDWQLWLRISARYKLHHFNEVSFCAINHSERSVNNLTESRVRYNADKLALLLSEDNMFLSYYGTDALKNLKAHMLTYGALHLAMSNEKLTAVKLFINGIILNYREIFRRRTLAVIKKILL